jgi:CBS domain-containing protein
MSIKVEEIMVKPAVTLSVSSSVREAVEIMSKNEIRCIVVLYDNGAPVGIITERDMLERVLLASKDPSTTRLWQIMSAPIIFTEPKASVEYAVTLMAERRIKQLPVIEENRVVGLVAITDLIRSKAYLEYISSSLSAQASA